MGFLEKSSLLLDTTEEHRNGRVNHFGLILLKLTSPKKICHHYKIAIAEFIDFIARGDE